MRQINKKIVPVTKDKSPKQVLNAVYYINIELVRYRSYLVNNVN